MGIALLALLILGNGLLAMAEMSVVSSRRSRLRQWVEEGRPRARAALDLAESPTTFLSTVQVGITLVGVLAGAFGESAVADDVAAFVARYPALAPYREVLATVIVVGCVTYFSLVLGELVPKRLALLNAESIACRVATPSRWLARLALPLVKLLSLSTDGVLRLLRAGPHREAPVTEEEIKLLIEQAASTGVFTSDEEDLLQSAVRLGDRDAEGLMTPRPEVEWLDLTHPPGDLLEQVAASARSRFPAAREDLDHLVGVVELRAVTARLAAGETVDFGELAQPAVVVPQTMRAMRLLRRFREARTHFVVVIDEYGGFAGVVTPTDLLEELLGELPDADSPTDEPIFQRDDGSWLVDGRLSTVELRELLEVRALPWEGEYATVAGLVLRKLSRLAKIGDRVEVEGYRIEVVDLDGMRIDKVLIAKL